MSLTQLGQHTYTTLFPEYQVDKKNYKMNI